jgi:hypothetical protein
MMPLIPLLLLTALTTTARAETCTDATDAALAAASRARTAFDALDEAGFDRAYGEALGASRCVHRLLTPAEARSLHEVFALGEFANGHPEATKAHFAAIKALDPSWRPPTANPRLGPLYAVDVEPTTAPARSLPTGQLVIDGTPTDVVPTHRAYFAQATSADGKVIFAGMLRSAGDLPALGNDRVVIVKSLGERLFKRVTVGAVGGGVARTNRSATADWIAAPPSGGVGGGWLTAQVGARFGADAHVVGGVGQPFDGHVGGWVAAGPAKLGVGVGGRYASLYRVDGPDGMMVAFPDASASIVAKLGGWDLDTLVDIGVTVGFQRVRAVTLLSPGRGLTVGLDASVAALSVPKAASLLELTAGLRVGVALGDPARGR